MTAKIFLEGGGDAKDLKTRCREGFRQLLEACGFTKQKPALVACGGRRAVYDRFKMAHATDTSGEYVAMWIDSEDPIDDIEATWRHLRNRKEDGWARPKASKDDQVLLMTTCMETWIICDRDILKKHFGKKLQASALPPLSELENRHRKSIQEALIRATRNCSNAYAKGKRSFELLGKLDPAALDPHLPSFRRVLRILEERL